MYLEIKDVKKSYGSDASYIQVLKGITTSLEKGQMCVIQGTSGSGKSTLLRCLNMLETPSTGEINYHGTDITSKNVNVPEYRSNCLLYTSPSPRDS